MKRNNIGYLDFKKHKNFIEPNAITIKKKHGDYSLSFCYDDDVDDESSWTSKENLEYLKTCDRDYLEKHTVGIDRGVAIPVQCDDDSFDFSAEQKRKKHRKEKHIKRYQKRLAKQKFGSNRRYKTKKSLYKAHKKVANIRKDFCHKTSRKIVGKPLAKVIILEDLNTKGIPKKPKAKSEGKGGWLRNKARAKAGLNRSVLDKGWHQLEAFVLYEPCRLGKAVFKVNAHHISQECSACGYTHPNNRKNQAKFSCGVCGNMGNADYNAAKVIKLRAIKRFLGSGTELSMRNVLVDKGCGAIVRRKKPTGFCAKATKRQKRRRILSKLPPEATPL